MIPTITDICRMLADGKCGYLQAVDWINEHMRLAADNDDLRDHFAGLAMQSYLAQPGPGQTDTGSFAALEGIAWSAYSMADAMLEERACRAAINRAEGETT